MNVCVSRSQPEGCGHGGESDDGDQPEGRDTEKRQTEELQSKRSNAGWDRPGGENTHRASIIHLNLRNETNFNP